MIKKFQLSLVLIPVASLFLGACSQEETKKAKPVSVNLAKKGNKVAKASKKELKKLVKTVRKHAAEVKPEDTAAPTPASAAQANAAEHKEVQLSVNEEQIANLIEDLSNTLDEEGNTTDATFECLDGLDVNSTEVAIAIASLRNEDISDYVYEDNQEAEANGLRVAKIYFESLKASQLPEISDEVKSVLQAARDAEAAYAAAKAEDEASVATLKMMAAPTEDDFNAALAKNSQHAELIGKMEAAQEAARPYEDAIAAANEKELARASKVQSTLEYIESRLNPAVEPVIDEPTPSTPAPAMEENKPADAAPVDAEPAATVPAGEVVDGRQMTPNPEMVGEHTANVIVPRLYSGKAVMTEDTCAGQANGSERDVTISAAFMSNGEVHIQMQNISSSDEEIAQALWSSFFTRHSFSSALENNQTFSVENEVSEQDPATKFSAKGVISESRDSIDNFEFTVETKIVNDQGNDATCTMKIVAESLKAH